MSLPFVVVLSNNNLYKILARVVITIHISLHVSALITSDWSMFLCNILKKRRVLLMKETAACVSHESFCHLGKELYLSAFSKNHMAKNHVSSQEIVNQWIYRKHLLEWKVKLGVRLKSVTCYEIFSDTSVFTIWSIPLECSISFITTCPNIGTVHRNWDIVVFAKNM